MSVYPRLSEKLNHHDPIESYHSEAMKAWATSCSDSLIDFTNSPRSKHLPYLSLFGQSRDTAHFFLISTIFQDGKILKNIDLH